MTGPHSDADFPEESSGFDSRDSAILIIDGPGDTTVRPAPASLLPFLLAQREKLARLQELKNQSPPPEQLPNEQEHNRNDGQ
jgi:hypothetical protein